MKHKGYNNVINGTDHPYGFNGVEETDELELNMLEMDVRRYDPAIARWTSIDPVTHHSLSPYNGFDNNPVYWSDPSGADAWTYVGNGEYVNTRTGEETTDHNRAIGETANEGSRSESSNDEGSEEECCGDGRVEWFNDNRNKRYLKGEITKDQFFEEAQAQAEGAIEGLLWVSGEFAVVRIIQGGKWVYRLVKANRILKNSKYVQLATGNITNTGKTVLGHWDKATGGYISKAKELGASYFDIGAAWNKLSNAERWALNKHFLNQVIQKGDTVILSVAKRNVKPNSYLAKEINHLIDNGYKWVDDFTLKMQ